MTTLKKYQKVLFSILFIAFAVLLPKFLPSEIKQQLSVDTLFMVVHIAFLILSLFKLWKASEQTNKRKKAALLLSALILFVFANLALWGVLLLQIHVIIIGYGLWSFVHQTLEDSYE